MFILVKWYHDFPNEPYLLYSELDNQNNEIRKIEVYKNGSFGYAYSTIENNGTKLSEYPLPSISEIAMDKQFEPIVISEYEFSEKWNKYVLGNSPE